MRPAARVQAAIEILDAIILAGREGGAAADTLIQRYFAQRRYAGSKDRRAVRELVYRAVRRSGDRPANGRAAMLGLTRDDDELAALFDGSDHAPAPIEGGEGRSGARLVPTWLGARLDPLVADGAEQEALLARAPLDVRVNALKGTLADARAALPDAVPTPLSSIGLRLPEGFAVEGNPAWNTGLVEIQDEGSQLLVLAAEPRPGTLIVDLCAGAGGKALAFAALTDNRADIRACDVDRARLAKLSPRMARAGAKLETLLLDPGRELDALADLVGRADLVFVDAPCSGTGTWRRNPETRWRLNAKRLDQLVTLQAHLLDIAAALVRPGGALVYAVCSVLQDEGSQQAEAFGARHSSFVSETPVMTGGRPSGPGLLLTPGHDGTDGFFVARWRAEC